MQPRITKKQPALAIKPSLPTSDDTLRQLAFENSLQPNIITVVSTGRVIMANKAAAKLLGYPIAVLLTKNRSGIFAIAEKNFKKMLKERIADGHSAAQVTAITSQGKEMQCEITSAVFAGKDRVKKAITTITDISYQLLKQKKADVKKDKAAEARSDAKIAVNNEWIKHIAKASYDVMWDWNVLSGEVYVGDSVRETFGYNIKNNTMRYEHFLHCLLPQDKITFQNKMDRSVSSAAKSWKNACVVRCFDGSLAATISRASIIRDESGRVVRLIGATQNVTALQTLENKLQEQSNEQQANTERFNLAAKLSYDVIWEWDLSANEFFLGEGIEQLGGGTGSPSGDTTIDWNVFVHPEDKAMVKKEMANALGSSALYWELAHRIATGSNNVAHVFNKASITRDSNGKACRMIGVIHDLSLKKEMEEKLEQEIRIKEKQIEEAIEDAKGAARTYIAKELHDNVNQLLAASAMFINRAKKEEKTRRFTWTVLLNIL
jgi:PAS domain S-box-containing protein